MAVSLFVDLETRGMMAPSVGLEEAARRRWDALIVGAGPAGALAAREIARRGRSVLLVDKASFPRWKVCGACLSRRALTILDAAGLGDLAERSGAISLKSLWLASPGRRAAIPLPGGAALSRAAFDAALVDAAIRAGAAFLPSTRALLADAHSEARTVRLFQRDEATLATARLVLAADGLGGTLAPGQRQVQDGSRIGAGTAIDRGPDYYREGTAYLACGAAGYVGLVRCEDGRLNIAAAFDPLALRDGGPGPAAMRLLDKVGWPAPAGLDGLSWRGTAPLTRRAAPAAERLFVLGDAAGYVEPFTGEGIAWALAAAVAVAPLAIRAVQHWEPALARQWQARYHQTVGRRQRLCRAAAGVLRRPALVSALLAVLGRAPWLAAPVIHRLNAAITHPTRF